MFHCHFDIFLLIQLRQRSTSCYTCIVVDTNKMADGEDKVSLAEPSKGQENYDITEEVKNEEDMEQDSSSSSDSSDEEEGESAEILALRQHVSY